MRRITDEKAREIAIAARNKDCKNAPKFVSAERTKGIAFSITVAAVLVALFFFMFPNVDLKNIEPARAKPDVFAVSLNAESSDSEVGMDELADHSAIFLPTNRNHRQKHLNPLNPEGWDISGTDSIKLGAALADRNFVDLSDIENIEAGKTSLIRSTMRRAFLSAGRSHLQLENISPIPPNTEIVDLNSGKTIRKLRLKNAVKLPAPLMFTTEIYKDGNAHFPITAISSGDDKYDNLIKKDFILELSKNPVPAGNYRITVSP